MSQLQRSFAKAKLSGLPFDPPLSPIQLEEQEDQEDQEDKDELNNLKSSSDPAQDDDSSSASSASSASSTGTITPSPSKHLFARPKGFVYSLHTTAVVFVHAFFLLLLLAFGFFLYQLIKNTCLPIAECLHLGS